ncbi:MAG TPA: cupin domain-containing protein, partial [Panacibacter sp.]|nr:cupin domain-containing protein [Panacibacter sp.]
YCLGLLNGEDCKTVEQYRESYPYVKEEIDSFMASLEQYALDCAVLPGKDIKNKTLRFADNQAMEDQANIQNLPLLNKYSSHENWLKIVKPLLPAQLMNDKMFIHELRNSNGIAQMVIWTAIDYPDEVHSDEQECFIILEGRCRCYIDDRITEMGPGDFLEIPLHAHHDVQVLEPVLALVQRIKAA